MKNFGGNTALHSAVVKGGKCAEELVKVLKKYGADPKIRNNNISREDEEESTNSSYSQTMLPVVKTEDSDSEEDSSKTGESSFDLARSDSKLMQLLRDENVEKPVEEELDLKQESEVEMMLPDRVFIQSQSVRNRMDVEERRIPATTKAATATSARQQLSQNSWEGEEKLSDEHVNRIKHILDRTGGWEKLAQYTNHGSLVRLYRKTSSPSSALFVKIRLQQPDITVRQVKKLLIDVQAFEAASALEHD